MKRKFDEWLSIQLTKNPGRVVLVTILLFNVVFLLVSALIISNLALSGTEKMGFFEAAFYTITMILDAGCISFVVSDIGESGVVVAVVCLCIIVIGMISFTGAVIGYVTNYISGFIDRSNSSSQKLKLHGHIVILNWNTRASEIVNDLLYCETKQNVVVLVSSRKSEIEKEIDERLADTISRENMALKAELKNCNFVKRLYRYNNRKFKKNVTVIVKEGDVYSSRQLHDVSIEHAKTIIILGNDINNTVCKFEHKELLDGRSQGNSLTVKTLMQVSDMTAAADSDDNQRIIVEITDDWTWELVSKIIECKQVDQKCNIVPVRVNRILGQILSQFSLMPELNLVYKELFSNKGATFYTKHYSGDNEDAFVSEYLSNHKHAIPLTVMTEKFGSFAYFSAGLSKDIGREGEAKKSDYKVDWNRDYWIEHKNVIILGHNSKCKDIMDGFEAFRSEWNYKDGKGEIFRIVVIDDQKSLEKINYYKDYPFKVETVAANIYDKDLICTTIEEIVSSTDEDTSVLILSDDEVLNEEIDSNALANLVYVQDIINRKKAENPDFDEESIDVIVEIIDPKHHDIVNSYSINNVVISNRYISKMITQIGSKEALYHFYTDILTYDTDSENGYESKEIYTKKVSHLFTSIPKRCTAAEIIRAVYNASTDPSLPKNLKNPTVVLGYVKPGGKMVLFEGDQDDIEVELGERDKIIVFSTH